MNEEVGKKKKMKKDKKNKKKKKKKKNFSAVHFQSITNNAIPVPS